MEDRKEAMNTATINAGHFYIVLTTSNTVHRNQKTTLKKKKKKRRMRQDTNTSRQNSVGRMLSVRHASTVKGIKS